MHDVNNLSDENKQENRHEATQIAMRRVDLNLLPELRLPEGYGIRCSYPTNTPEGAKDAEAWCDIMAAAFPEDAKPTLEKWQQQIIEYHGYAPENVFFIIAPDGVPCATASAMTGANAQEGYIHWVGINPAHAGKKLGLLVSLQCLHRFAERGCETAILETNTFRLPAIKVYLNLGFVPRLTKPEHIQRWEALKPIALEKWGLALPEPLNELSA